MRRRQTGEDLRELAVGKAEVAFEDGRKYGAVVGRHGKVAAKKGRSERPLGRFGI